VSSLSGISKAHPSRSGLLSGLALTCAVLLQPVASRVYLLQPHQRGQQLDAANQGVSNGHSL